MFFLQLLSLSRVLLLSIFLVGLGASLATSQSQSSSALPESEFWQTHNDATSFVINEYVSNFSRASGDVFWSHSVSMSATRYIRFRFDRIISPPGIGYRIRIVKEPEESEVVSYDSAEFANADTFVSGLLPPGKLRVELVAPNRPQGLSFTLQSVVWQARSKEAKPLAAVIRIKSVLPSAPTVVRQVARAVVMLHIGPAETTCSSVLVASDKVLTNFHCLLSSTEFLRTEKAEKPACHDIDGEFDYLTKGQRGRTARCVAVKVDEANDLAILTLSIDSALASDVRSRVVKLRPPGSQPSQLTLVHYPSGLPLSYEQNCSIPKIDKTDVEHDCTTTPGSSGSPLFDENMDLYALHYKGPYAASWTVAMIDEDFHDYGPKYNRAKKTDVIARFVGD